MSTESREREPTAEEILAGIQLKQAEAMKMLAEAALAKSDALKKAAETREATARAQGFAIDLREKRRGERIDIASHAEWLASDARHHVYQFTGKVDDSSTKMCMHQLAIWHRTEPDCPMEIVFHSPGGNVIDGMALFDYILGLRSQGHHVTTTARGYAASMAGILLQSGDVRRMGKEAYLLIHEISTGAIGKIGEIEDEVTFVKKIQSRVLDIFVDRAGGKIKKATMERKWRRKDWWLSSDEALRYGLVDEIG
ncbi:MAG: ATP-dependent Clp protease proteolytic subunit [Thermoleophilia bacterium]|nr:ATP-dependent Clp protease proteolytic subunit [Thermoleophilia bacterium]